MALLYDCLIYLNKPETDGEFVERLREFFDGQSTYPATLLDECAGVAKEERRGSKEIELLQRHNELFQDSDCRPILDQLTQLLKKTKGPFESSVTIDPALQEKINRMRSNITNISIYGCEPHLKPRSSSQEEESGPPKCFCC